MSSPRIAIVIYSMYGHIAKRMFYLLLICVLCLIGFAVAEAAKAGIEAKGGKATIYQ
jgi:hypothetical protein